MERKYHRVTEKLPEKDGRYMVKFKIADMPEYDNTEIAFREYKDGKWDVPYYSDPTTDTLVGWYEGVE